MKMVNIDDLKGILKDLKDINERYNQIVRKSELSGVYMDEFGEKINELAQVVGDAIGRETVSQFF